MLSKLAQFYRLSLTNFVEACVNLVVFLPYFFSIPSLFKTLFFPWKNLVTKKNSAGFSLNEWFGIVAFNTISSIIGFLMRISIILFYFIFQSALLLFLPFIFIIYLILIPILFLDLLLQKSDDQKKEISRLKFIGAHLLNQENYSIVAAWFEDYYKKFIHKTYWFKRSNLFSIPPLARDWAVGFTPTLDQYGQDLTSSPYQTKTLAIVDREKEIDEIERALSKSQEANVVIVGEEGVGKHTIVVALAKRLYEGKTKSLLMYKRIVWLNMQKVLNQETDLAKRENFFEELLLEAAAAKNVIIFIDDIDQYISAERGNADLTTSFEKFAKTNQLQFLGITTPFFFEKYFLTNSRLYQLFSKIDVKEVVASEAEKILLQLAYTFEERYKAVLPYETLKTAIQKSDYYITSIPFPEKAIDLLDSACVLAQQEEHNVVTPEYVDKVLAEKTHVPTSLTENTKQKLIHLESLLQARIVNQEPAISKLSSALRRSFLLLGKRKKPLASFLFLGPTGVGKTETAKAVAKIFFGQESYLIRFDMSNYQSVEDIPKLIGSLDSGNPGLLAKEVRENPYGVLLLDEIEKANKDLVNIFLTVLDEGYFTDGFGKRVDCKNLVIIATSNAGSDLFYNESIAMGVEVEGLLAARSRGLSDPKRALTGGKPRQDPSQTLINYLIEQKIFSPEFLNRFDAVISYNPLDKDSAKQIAQKMVQKISEDVFNLHKVKINVSEAYLSELISKGYEEKFGARNLERLLRDEIEDKIAKLVLEGKAREGESIQL